MTMSIIAKDGGKEFAKIPLPEAGTTQAVCCGVWDLGNQKTKYQNEDGSDKYQHKIVIAWEISERINEPSSEYNGKPYMMTKTYTLSLGEKANLRRDLESWRGKPFTAEDVKQGFDLEKLYGVNCFIGIKHETSVKNGNTYANVTAILPLPKGTEKIQPVRGKDEKPPKWVSELQNVSADNLPTIDEAADELFGVPEVGSAQEDEI